VEVLVDGVRGVRARRVGRRRQYVGLAGDADDVRGVPAAGAFGVVGVDRAPVDRGEGGFQEAAFVERVGVDGDLHPELFGAAQRGVDGRGGAAPVLVQLQAAGAGADLLRERFAARGVSLAEQQHV